MSTPYNFEAPVQGVPAPVVDSFTAQGGTAAEAAAGMNPGESQPGHPNFSGPMAPSDSGESDASIGAAAEAAGAAEGAAASASGNDGSTGVAWAQGGLLALAAGGMAKGGFVVPADVVSALGNGSTDAGIRTLRAKLGAIKHIKGKGDGLSDSIPTNIDGRQPARVADGEVYVDPKTVAKIGGGDMKKGAKKLYAMMDKVRQQAHGKKSQQREVSPAKALSA
tara:strand:+ start:201 stop:866 length:666 start_codon:yes stop_codon:yes gene_type:complete